MYTPQGHGLSEVGDIEVFPVGDELHLFHLTLPNHDVVQHAVSDDGLAWRALPPALRTGDPGNCDDDQIWTMSVTERGGVYHVLYTVLATADDGMVQRTALARSTDLIRWEKDPRNPSGAADPRWYEADPAESGSVSWRDPKPTHVADTYYATVAARERSGPLLRRGCVGLLVSRDPGELGGTAAALRAAAVLGPGVPADLHGRRPDRAFRLLPDRGDHGGPQPAVLGRTRVRGSIRGAARRRHPGAGRPLRRACLSVAGSRPALVLASDRPVHRLARHTGDRRLD